MSRNIGCGLVAVLASIAPSSRVAAQPSRSTSPDSVRVVLAVEADARCATTSTLAAQVRARSSRVELVDDSRDAPRIRVAIGGAATGNRVAELSVQWPDGRRSERRLTAGTCAAAVEALALLIAMTLDPAAFGAEPPPPAGQPGDAAARTAAESPPAAAPRTDATDAAATGAAALTKPPASTATAPASPPAPHARSSAQARAPHPLGVAHVAAGASAQLASGPAPRAMPGLGAYARLALNGAEWWAPALQLQLARTWVSGLSEAGGDAGFTLESAALDVCPLGVRLAPFSAHACFASAIGRLTARGSNSYLPRTRHELWSSLGGRMLLTVGLGAWLEVQAGLGLARPLQRYRFAFRPDVFHRVPGVCLDGHLGLGVRFP